MTQKTRRLARVDWLETGLQALADSGPSALKAEALARRLKTTKGSFYWHFDDIPAYHAALLTLWEERTAAALEATLEGRATAVSKLRATAQMLARTGQDPEMTAESAIRAWARDHSGARATLARVDAQRLDLIGRLLADIGIANPEMARIIYATGIGIPDLPEDAPGRNISAIGSLVDLVLALR
jgi:AcrR family transcriptional regulator